MHGLASAARPVVSFMASPAAKLKSLRAGPDGSLLMGLEVRLVMGQAFNRAADW